MDPALEAILPKVQKPARYTGGEFGEIIKDKREVELRFALCFPDTYEIGMSNLGFRILYGVLNKLPGVWCERVFEPWSDTAEAMDGAGIPLYALESGDPLRDFDLIGFSVGYEMSFPGILHMLKMAGIGVAMGNAIEAVKEIADVVIGTNDEDGIAEWLSAYLQA